MLTAEYGGTGGKPLEGGMVVEEPDIEIGAGVSSKAISRRMVTDRGGQKGQISGGRDGPHSDRYRQPAPRDERPNNGGNQRSDNAGAGNLGGGGPAPPNFGNFQFPQMPGGFQFPPGFTFPNMGSPAGGQPPAPGSN